MKHPAATDKKALRDWIDRHRLGSPCFAPAPRVPEAATLGGINDPAAIREAVDCLIGEQLTPDQRAGLVRCVLRSQDPRRGSEQRLTGALAHIARSISTESNEHFLVVWLDPAGRARRVIRYESRNGPDHAWVDVRRLLRDGVVLGAAECVSAHNHPDGLLRASADDRSLHRFLARSLAELGIGLLANVVVTPRGAVDIGSGRGWRWAAMSGGGDACPDEESSCSNRSALPNHH
jgi:hypothetical protein